MSDRETISATLNSIESSVGANELSAYQVFTRMKRLVQAAQAKAGDGEVMCNQHRPNQICPHPASCRVNGCSAVEREIRGCKNEQTDEWYGHRFKQLKDCLWVCACGTKLYTAPPAAAVNQQLPEGHAPVPVEPTEAMIDAGVAVAFATSVHGKGGWNNYMKALYRAFIAAAQEVGNE